MTADERARLELAALYRLFARQGWTDLTYTHISARVPSRPSHYFINAYGLLFEEVCASNLLEVDFTGRVVGEAAPVNRVGIEIHSAVLSARPELNFVLHSHTIPGVAVSAMARGLLPISQHANTVLHTIGYHRYDAIHDTPDDRARLITDLADRYLLIMHNHGLLACGRTAGEAFLYLYFLEQACAIQLAAVRTGEQLLEPPAEVRAQLSRWGAPRDKPWGDKQWTALLRQLDRSDPSYRA